RALLTGDQAVPLPFGTAHALDAQYDTVILFFIDAFGWRFFEQYADEHPFLQRLMRDGIVSQLTTQFPSTTAAHVTTIHTGLPVGQHGIFEWFYYEPHLDTMIAPLLYSYAGDAARETLRTTGIPATTLFPLPTVYHTLAEQGIAS